MRREGTSKKVLHQKVETIKNILKLNGGSFFSIGSSHSDEQFERIILKAKQIDFHRHDIMQIEKQADLELSWIHYCHDPDFCKRHPQMPKHMEEYTNGEFIQIMFVKDLRGK